jgi:ethanolamine utilization protein EutN
MTRTKASWPPQEINNMILGRVIGNVVATAKDPSLDGIKLLLVQPIGRDGLAKGRAVVALDSVGAGAGEMVYWCRGREASFPFLPAEVPTEATIVGIVDEVNLVDAAKLAKE